MIQYQRYTLYTNKERVVWYLLKSVITLDEHHVYAVTRHLARWLYDKMLLVKVRLFILLFLFL
jgi:hypothetical protein